MINKRVNSFLTQIKDIIALRLLRKLLKTLYFKGLFQ